MTLIKLKHIDRFRDRHGKSRYYYRAGKGGRVEAARLARQSRIHGRLRGSGEGAARAAGADIAG